MQGRGPQRPRRRELAQTGGLERLDHSDVLPSCDLRSMQHPRDRRPSSGGHHVGLPGSLGGLPQGQVIDALGHSLAAGLALVSDVAPGQVQGPAVLRNQRLHSGPSVRGSATGTGASVRLGDYFARRLTRLEPPYLISLTGFYLLLRVVNGLPVGIAQSRLPDRASRTCTTSWAATRTSSTPWVGPWKSRSDSTPWHRSWAFVFAVRNHTARRLLIVGAGHALMVFQWHYIDGREVLAHSDRYLAELHSVLSRRLSRWPTSISSNSPTATNIASALGHVGPRGRAGNDLGYPSTGFNRFFARVIPRADRRHIAGASPECGPSRGPGSRRLAGCAYLYPSASLPGHIAHRPVHEGSAVLPVFLAQPARPNSCGGDSDPRALVGFLPHHRKALHVEGLARPAAGLVPRAASLGLNRETQPVVSSSV